MRKQNLGIVRLFLAALGCLALSARWARAAPQRMGFHRPGLPGHPDRGRGRGLRIRLAPRPGSFRRIRRPRFLLDVSHGKMEYDLDVADYYMARNNKAYYDRADGYNGAFELVKEALQGLDASKLTKGAAGTVVSVNVLFAGAAGAVWAQGLWAHRGNISALTLDGVRVSGYMLAYIGNALAIGTFVHESGHLLFGWPDLYDYDSDSRGTGAYCLMSGQDSKNPQPPNAYLRAGNNASFTGQTAPDSKWWNGSESGLGLVNISAVEDTMTFGIQGRAVEVAGGPGAAGAFGPWGEAGQDGRFWRLDGKSIRRPAHKYPKFP